MSPSKKNRYTREEIKFLCAMVEEEGYKDPGCLHHEAASSLRSSNYSLDEAFLDGEIDVQVLRSLGLTVLKYWEKETIDLINHVPIEDVPLYINDRVNGVVARWRLRICK